MRWSKRRLPRERAGAGPKVIAQLNRRMVAPAGSLLMNPAQIDVLIENDVSAPALMPAIIDDAAQEIED